MTLSIIGLVYLSGIGALPWNCGANIGCSCLHTGTYDVKNYTYEECIKLYAIDGCVFCNPDDSLDGICHNESVNPIGGLYCWPKSKQCALCGYVPEIQLNTYIAPGYTLYIREKCKVSSYCNEQNVLDVQENIVFNTSKARDLVIDGLGMTINAPCPLFTFEMIDRVVLGNMTINCISNDKDFAPAILIHKVTQTIVEAHNIHAIGDVKSAVTVLGGIFTENEIKTTLDMDKSKFSNIHITSKYRMSMALSLASFYGQIDFKGMNNFSRVIIQPSIDAETDSTATIINKPPDLILFNFTEWTRIFGRDYELILNNNESTLGYALSEDSVVQQEILQNALIVLIVLISIIMLRYYNTIIYMRKLKSD